jgi:phage terminase large subunit-like protein
MTNCNEIDEYIRLVRSGKYRCCKEQYLLCDLVEKIFSSENLRVDQKQLDKYLSYQKYFPFKLFEWEKFCFALHNCVYTSDERLRFPILFIYVGRGAGKNGYLGFEDFCLLTKANGIQEYNIDIFATSEDQAKTSWDDVYNVLENSSRIMERHFSWTKELITCTDTKSEFRFRTANAKTKDGGRPGKVDFDEIHAYENYKLIDVATTGTGKKKFPRRTYCTTDGNVREGPLDHMKERALDILEGKVPDNGQLPFICRLDSEEEVHDKLNWTKANPSLPYLPDLMQEMELEYYDYSLNPAANVSFMTKRMNRPPKVRENEVTSWENILATNIPIDESAILGRPCVAGIDYMKTTDFLGAGLLWRVNGIDYWLSHTWICSQSADLHRIKPPLREWEARGLVTFVDAAEIPPELPCIWLENEARKRKSQILTAGIDDYRYALMRNALLDINFSADKDYANVRLLRPSDEMRRIPIITSGFVNHKFAWGDSPVMRWMCNNSKTETSAKGNITYGKIEPKSRKTDTFKAFVAAECVSDILDTWQNKSTSPLLNIGVFSY